MTAKPSGRPGAVTKECWLLLATDGARGAPKSRVLPIAVPIAVDVSPVLGAEGPAVGEDGMSGV